MSIWQFITDFGDTAITVPLAALTLLFLLAARQSRLAVVWALAIVGCVGAVGGLKLVLDACNNPLLSSAGLRSPSGHSAMSAAVYGGFAAIVGAQLPRPARTAMIVAAAALIVAIPVSRVALHLHSRIEVVVGLAIGLIAFTMFTSAASDLRERLPIMWFAGAAIILAVFFHGERWPAEQAIHDVAGWLEILRPWCG